MENCISNAQNQVKLKLTKFFGIASNGCEDRELFNASLFVSSKIVYENINHSDSAALRFLHNKICF